MLFRSVSQSRYRWSILFPGFFNISSLTLSRTSSFSSLRIDFKEFLYSSSSPGNFPTYIPCIVVYPSRLFPAGNTVAILSVMMVCVLLFEVR